VIIVIILLLRTATGGGGYIYLIDVMDGNLQWLLTRIA
jgi:hypothetical protein